MNKRRIWQMTKLAMFEEYNNKDLEIANFYRRDYVALGMISNLIMVTAAYLLILAGICIVRFNYLTDNFYKIDFQQLLVPAVIGYIILIAIYSLLVYIIRRTRYNNAERRVENYYNKLSRLSESYDRENAGKEANG